MTSSTTRRAGASAAAVVAAALVLGGCGPSGGSGAHSSGGSGAHSSSVTTSSTGQPSATTPRSSSASSPPASFPVTVSAANGQVRIATRPTHIVSLSPTVTETLFAIGAGSQVTAVDNQSDYPANAPHSSLSGFDPNIEAVLAKHPDLVILSYAPAGLIGKLTAAKVPVIDAAAANNLTDVYTQIDMIGKATGDEGNAISLVSRMKSQIGALVARTPKPKKALSYYHELDSQLHTAKSDTFIGTVYGLFGLHDIADKVTSADGDYPQLSAEYLITASPQLIFLADEGGSVTPASVARRPGFSRIAAVKNNHVIALDPDIASRWGPRVVDYVRVVARAVTAAESSG